MAGEKGEMKLVQTKEGQGALIFETYYEAKLVFEELKKTASENVEKRRR
jgi:hypothetical protein